MANAPQKTADLDTEIDDDVDDVDDGMFEITNVSSSNATWSMDGRTYKLKPGQKTRVPKEYCVERDADPGNPQGGNKLPPIIEMLTGKRVKYVKPAPPKPVDPKGAR